MLRIHNFVARRLSPRKGLVANLHSQNRCPPFKLAQGIAAESPQELHGQFRGLGAESPVAATRRCAQNKSDIRL
jgi:hypothetical protein